MSEFTFSNIKYYSYDISGLSQRILSAFSSGTLYLISPPARRLWRDYYEAARDGVIFLVDSSGIDRFAEAREELHVLLSAQALSNVPFLVLGTKTDAPGAVSEDELRQQLRLVETTGKVGLNVWMDSARNLMCYQSRGLDFPLMARDQWSSSCVQRCRGKAMKKVRHLPS